MPETKPIPVRLGDDIIARLDKAADRIGNNRAGIIRFLVVTWLDHFEKHGKAALPADWEDVLASYDHRTIEARLALEIQKKVGLNDSSSTNPEGVENVGQKLAESVISYGKRRAARSSRPGKIPRKAKVVPPSKGPAA